MFYPPLPKNVEKMNTRSYIYHHEKLESVWKVSWGDSLTLLLFGVHRQAEEGETRWWHQLLRAERRGKLSSGRKVYNSVMKDLELTLLSFPCLQPWSAHCAWTDMCFWKPILKRTPVFLLQRNASRGYIWCQHENTWTSCGSQKLQKHQFSDRDTLDMWRFHLTHLILCTQLIQFASEIAPLFHSES